MPKWQVILLGAVVGLTGACGGSASSQLSSQAEARSAEEVRATFQTMSDAIIALDLDQALALFDESAPPVHSVDGQIFVGMDEIERAYRSGMAAVAEFNRVDIVTEQLEVLGADAASYALSFEESFQTVEGDTVDIRGVWTLVFHRTPEGWRVVHSAASHGT